MVRKIKNLIALILCAIIISSFVPKVALAEEQTFTTNYDEDTIHTILEDGITAVVYCLNNKYVWPHSLINNQKPSYLSGYDYIENHENSYEIIEKLEKILHAGYPYNSQNLFSIVDDVQITVTKDDLNNYLIPSNEIVLAFNKVNIDLTPFQKSSVNLDNYQDYKGLISELYSYVVFTMKDTDKLSYSIDGVEHTLTLADIMSTEFFKTITSIVLSEDNPELYYSTYYPSYHVTKYQAYYATNCAIWKLMYDYGIEGNDINFISNSPLAKAIYDYAVNSTEDLLTDYDDVTIPLAGDFTFKKNNDGKFYSGEFKITESRSYNGAFKLSLPNDSYYVIDAKTGSAIETDEAKNALLYNNNSYILVSDTIPNDSDEFILESTILYRSRLRLYSPKEDVTYNGKPYQKLGGLHLHSKVSKIKFKYIDISTGNIKVSKSVVSPIDNKPSTDEEFNFTINLFNPNINGTYGDITFNNGLAEFTLKDSEVKTISHIPEGTNYEITEGDAPGYISTSENSKGVITSNNTEKVKFINTKTHTSYSKSSEASTGNLKITKIVSGNDTDFSKPFDFVIKLSNPNITGNYGDMQFLNGTAKITLKHNESKVATGLPTGVSYEIIENNAEGYTVKSKNSNGTIGTNEIVAEFENIWLDTNNSNNSSVNDTTTDDTITDNTITDDTNNNNDDSSINYNSNSNSSNENNTSNKNSKTNNTTSLEITNDDSKETNKDTTISKTSSNTSKTNNNSTTNNNEVSTNNLITTGDSSNIVLWSILLLLSVIGIMTLLYNGKYSKVK